MSTNIKFRKFQTTQTDKFIIEFFFDYLTILKIMISIPNNGRAVRKGNYSENGTDSVWVVIL